MRQHNTKAQEKQNHKMIPTPCPPTHNYPPPTYPIPPIPSHIVCNNNTVDMVLLVQMRQYNKCGSVRNDEIVIIQDKLVSFRPI